MSMRETKTKESDRPGQKVRLSSTAVEFVADLAAAISGSAHGPSLKQTQMESRRPYPQNSANGKPVCSPNGASFPALKIEP